MIFHIIINNTYDTNVSGKKSNRIYRNPGEVEHVQNLLHYNIIFNNITLYFDADYLVLSYVMYHVCCLCFCVWRF